MSHQSSRAPWEEALVARPNPGPHDNEKNCVKVHGDTRKGRRHGICGMLGGLARGHDGSPPVERDFLTRAWDRMTRWDLLVGCDMAMITSNKPSAFPLCPAQKRDGVL